MSEPTDAQKLGAGCGLVLVIAAIAFGASLFGGGDEPDEPAGPTDEGAISVCEQSVARKLKAPATAEFSGEAATTPTADLDEFVVTGFVDAENSFGAKIRNAWRCEATWIEGTEWSASSTLVE